MLVFKTYFKFLYKMRGLIILYYAIFMAVALIMTINMSKDESETFDYTSLNLSIINYDDGEYAKMVKAYFEEEHKFVDMKDDEDYILNEIYWHAIDYVLIVPKGFSESLTTEAPMELECRKVPGDFDSSYFEAELSQYTAKLTALLKSGYTMEEADDMLMSLRDQKAEITMASYVNAAQNDKVSTFFSYAPYLLITLCVVCIGRVLLSFNKKDIKNRIECGSTPLKERSIAMIISVLASGILILASLILIAAIISKGKLFTDVRTPWFLLNALAMLLFCVSLGYFTGIVAKTEDSINGIVNTFSLALCFLGGIFVPLEFFGPQVAKIAKATPTYWYAQNNALIAGMKTVTSENLQTMLTQMGVILCFAIAFLAIAIVVQSTHRKASA